LLGHIPFSTFLIPDTTFLLSKRCPRRSKFIAVNCKFNDWQWSRLGYSLEPLRSFWEACYSFFFFFFFELAFELQAFRVSGLFLHLPATRNEKSRHLVSEMSVVSVSFKKSLHRLKEIASVSAHFVFLKRQIKIIFHQSAKMIRHQNRWDGSNTRTAPTRQRERRRPASLGHPRSPL
jgi:hypothetical protein